MLILEDLAVAVARHNVQGFDNAQLERVCALLNHVVRKHSAFLNDESIEDLTGPNRRIDWASAKYAARHVLESSIEVAKWSPDSAPYVGDADPLMAEAFDRLIVPPGKQSMGYAGDIADAARRVSIKIAEALSTANSEDLKLLASAKLSAAPVGRPPKGLALVRRLVRAAYFVQHCRRGDMAISIAASVHTVGQASDLLNLAFALLDALKVDEDAATVRREMIEYRGTLRHETEMRGHFEYGQPNVRHFLSNLIDWDDSSSFRSPRKTKT